MNVHTHAQFEGQLESKISSSRMAAANRSPAWKSNIVSIYNRMRAHRVRHDVQWGSHHLSVLPDVYAPNYFTDSYWFAEVVPQVVRRSSFLEIGSGTGIISIACAQAGARVVATDINPLAVENTRINAKRFDLTVDARLGDIFDPVPAGERFDYVFWAHPFNNASAPVSDPLLATGFDYQYRSAKRYFGGAKAVLKDGGKLLLGTADSADIPSLLSFANRGCYRNHILHRVTMPFEYGSPASVEYLLVEFAPI